MKVINARIETLNQKPSFVQPRVLILADVTNGVQRFGQFPYFFHRGGDNLLPGSAPRGGKRGPAIVTKGADENIQAIHHRMPFIVEENRLMNGYSKQTCFKKSQKALHKVSKFVNSQKIIRMRQTWIKKSYGNKA